MIIDTYASLSSNSRIFPKLATGYVKKLKNAIYTRYKSINDFNKREIRIPKNTFMWHINKASFPMPRIHQVVRILGFDIEKMYSNVEGFHIWGSRSPIKVIPRQIQITEDTAELLGLYYAEGDRSRNSCVCITNSNFDVVMFTQRLLESTFPDKEIKIVAVDPKKIKEVASEPFKVSKRTVGLYNKRTKYRIMIDDALYAKIMESLLNQLQNSFHRHPDLARGWARGMLAGEGTVRNAKERYMRVEMKDKPAIDLLSTVFEMFSIVHRVSERNDRPGMWVLYVGAKELQNLSTKIGFGCHKQRQQMLEEAATRG